MGCWLGCGNSGHLSADRWSHALRSDQEWKNSPKIVAYGAFDETVCTAPLGPIPSRISFASLFSSNRLEITSNFINQNVLKIEMGYKIFYWRMLNIFKFLVIKEIIWNLDTFKHSFILTPKMYSNIHSLLWIYWDTILPIFCHMNIFRY